MNLRTLKIVFVLCLFAYCAQPKVTLAQEVSPDSGSVPPWGLELLSHAPETFPAPEMNEDGVTGLYYAGLPYRGKPTRVFAWIGKPEVPAGTKVPGIVLVHGGGGTAFASWARLWVSRGYAVVAMDNCGALPIPDETTRWKRHEFSGPPGWGGFDQIQEAPEDQWAYHAVADIILAHSLLLSFPEVDQNRTGITGISWGGYLTCLTSGVDPRFKFAIPIYGCGFTEDNGFVIFLEKMSPEMRQRWMQWWDPSRTLGTAKMPMLWVNGTNDRWYTLNAYQKSYRLPQSERTICLRVRMPHGHGPAGENPKEIHVFADSIVNGGKPLAKWTSQSREGNIARGTFSSPVPIVRAELVFTEDSGAWQERLWNTIPAQIEGDQVSVEIPAGTQVYYLNLTDDRECVVSTEHEVLTKE